jgi:hypothetical protein
MPIRQGKFIGKKIMAIKPAKDENNDVEVEDKKKKSPKK